jgi:hypothetical protein
MITNGMLELKNSFTTTATSNFYVSMNSSLQIMAIRNVCRHLWYKNVFKTHFIGRSLQAWLGTFRCTMHYITGSVHCIDPRQFPHHKSLYHHFDRYIHLQVQCQWGSCMFGAFIVVSAGLSNSVAVTTQWKSVKEATKRQHIEREGIRWVGLSHAPACRSR